MPAQRRGPTTRRAFQTELRTILNAAAAKLSDGDPLLAPPIYGGNGMRRRSYRWTTPPGRRRWIDELNLDPRSSRRRGIRHAGRAKQQEALMASAWEQMGDIERANQRMRQVQLSLAVNTVLHVKHFSRLTEDALLQVAAPAQARIVWATPPLRHDAPAENGFARSGASPARFVPSSSRQLGGAPPDASARRHQPARRGAGQG